eukprot:GFKZ01003154.1.p2 GENE.GFKZ01003154.1~~GFKZ01003154.1.p2  ORF type:complete len:104 (-),score=7.15 GFKZ01003154.1:1046-1357(-)
MASASAKFSGATSSRTRLTEGSKGFRVDYAAAIEVKRVAAAETVPTGSESPLAVRQRPLFAQLTVFAGAGSVIRAPSVLTERYALRYFSCQELNDKGKHQHAI